MNKILALIGLTTVLAMQSCSNDFDVVDNWKDITIVYGLLDASQSVNYVRVEKAFLDEKTSALILAKEPDSLYYDNVTVELRKASTDVLIETLERVDYNTEPGAIVEPGIFATDPKYVYKIASAIEEGINYKLTVSNDDTGNSVSAEAVALSTFDQIAPNFSVAELTWEYDPSRYQKFVWFGNETTKFFDFGVVLNYKEYDAVTGDFIANKSLNWTINKNIPQPEGAPSISIGVDGESFYRFVGKSLTSDPSVVRCVQDMDLFIDGGGQALFDYINSNEANRGLSGGVNPAPIVTNVENGIGVFSSKLRFYKAAGVLASSVKDSLAFGQHTKTLGFKSAGSGPCN